jgi:hypothetical protein
MLLGDRLNEYRDAVQEAKNLIITAHVTDAAGVALWQPAETRIITVAAFLRFYVAWEVFLEGTVNDYMTGQPTASGTPIHRYATPLNQEHASKMVIGTQKYFDFTNPDYIRTMCKLYFNGGEPFDSVISSIRGDLFDLKTIRNAAAHIASTTSIPLDALASRKLLRPQVNVNVYDFILAIDPTSRHGETILDVYSNQLDAAAHLIAFA